MSVMVCGLERDVSDLLEVPGKASRLVLVDAGHVLEHAIAGAALKAVGEAQSATSRYRMGLASIVGWHAVGVRRRRHRGLVDEAGRASPWSQEVAQELATHGDLLLVRAPGTAQHARCGLEVERRPDGGEVKPGTSRSRHNRRLRVGLVAWRMNKEQQLMVVAAHGTLTRVH